MTPEQPAPAKRKAQKPFAVTVTLTPDARVRRHQGYPAFLFSLFGDLFDAEDREILRASLGLKHADPDTALPDATEGDER